MAFLARFGLLIILVLLTLSESAAQTRVRIGLAVPDVSNLLCYIGTDKDFFAAEGLKVELVQFQSDAAAAQALTAGAVLVNNASIFPVINSYLAGRDLTAIWSVSNLPGYIWYGLPKYTDITQLRGRGKVGVSSIGSMTYRVSSWAISRAGLDPQKDVSFLALGGPLERIAALRAEQVDIIPATAPGMFILENEGFRPLIRLQDIMPAFSYEVLYTRKGNIEKDLDLLRSVIIATIKASKWAQNNREESTQILMKNLGAPADQIEYYRKTIDFALPYFPDDGAFPADSIALFLGFYKEQGKLTAVPDQSAFIDYRFNQFFQNHPVR